jgi:hypothetical protein
MTIDEALAAHAESRRATEEAAAAILRRILSRDLIPPVNARDVYRRGFPELLAPDQVTSGLALLAARGVLNAKRNQWTTTYSLKGLR